MENYNNVTSTMVSHDPNKEVMSLGNWIITLIIGMVPCVNVIIYLVWAFGNGNENRKNYCRAILIVMLITVVISVIFGLVFGAAFSEAISQAY